jgi:hypothetical protein
MDTLALQELPEQFQCCLLVPSFLHQHVEGFAFVIDGAPQEHFLSTDPHNHFVEMPSRSGCRSRLSKIVTEQPAELPGPAPDGLITDIDASLGHQVLNIPKTQDEPKVQPHRLADDASWKSMASIGNCVHLLISPNIDTSSTPSRSARSITDTIAWRLPDKPALTSGLVKNCHPRQYGPQQAGQPVDVVKAQLRYAVPHPSTCQ